MASPVTARVSSQRYSLDGISFRARRGKNRAASWSGDTRMTTETSSERKFAFRMITISIAAVALLALFGLFAVGFLHHGQSYPRLNQGNAVPAAQ